MKCYIFFENLHNWSRVIQYILSVANVYLNTISYSKLKKFPFLRVKIPCMLCIEADISEKLYLTVYHLDYKIIIHIVYKINVLHMEKIMLNYLNFSTLFCKVHYYSNIQTLV